MAIKHQCRTKHGWAMIPKRSKVVKVNDITLSQDPSALVVDVTMEGVLNSWILSWHMIQCQSYDYGELNELGLTNMVPTTIILTIVDHTHLESATLWAVSNEYWRATCERRGR